MTVEAKAAGRLAPDPSIERSGALFSDMGAADTRQILDANGWTLHESRGVQCLYRPGKSAVVRRTAWATRQGAMRTFSTITEIGRSALRPGFAHDGSSIVPTPYVTHGLDHRTWVFPFDPHLPDLAETLSIDGARGLAEAVVGFRCSVRSAVVRYRPRKRAVVRYEVRPRGRIDGEPVVLYVKVVRPSSADRIMSVAAVLDRVDTRFVLPIARPRPGIVVYRGAGGRSMRDALTDRVRQAPLPGPDDLWSIPRRLAQVPVDELPNSAGPERRLDGALRLLSASVPHLERRLGRLEGQLRPHLADPPLPRVVVHGDYYEGQLLLGADGMITGVLDIDDVGIGDVAMDAANVCAHLTSLAESFPLAADRLAAYRKAVRNALIRIEGVDPSALAAREAVAALQLATGPLRILDPEWKRRTEVRIAIAESAFDQQAVS